MCEKAAAQITSLIPKNVLPNSIDIDEDKGKGGWAKGLLAETRDRGKPL